MQSNYVTNATRPLLPETHPMAAGGDADGCGDNGVRKTATNKIVIPGGSLADYVPHWLRPHGVGRAVIDYVIKNKEVFQRLAHENETTTARRQVAMHGCSKITNRTTERDLDAMAVDLIKRSFPASVIHLSSNDDEILTYFGFRSGPCMPDAHGARGAFVERIVALQLIVRRGVEVNKNVVDSNGTYNTLDNFPLYILSVPAYNGFDWDAALGSVEPPGTAVHQTLPRAVQDRNADLRSGSPPPQWAL